MAWVASPGSAAPAYARGLVAEAAGDVEAADVAFAEALAVRPDNVAAMQGRARCAVALGDQDAAIGLLRDAIGVAGAAAQPGVLRQLITLHRAAGDVAAATSV